MPCFRVSDGRAVPDSEALDASGATRPGYGVRSSTMMTPGQYIGFDMAFCDSAPGGTQIRDAPATFTDAETSAIVARAEMIHRTSNAYLGDHAPAFSPALATLAVQQAATDRARIADNTTRCAGGADAARIQAEVARAQMIDGLQNAWRK